MRAEDCIFFQLGRANRAGTRFLNQRVADLGITAVQAMALLFLAEADDVTSVHFGKSPPAWSAAGPTRRTGVPSGFCSAKPGRPKPNGSSP
jgi:hypothetical protein